MISRKKIIFISIILIALTIGLLVYFINSSNNCTQNELMFTIFRNYIPSLSGYGYTIKNNTHKIYDVNRISINTLHFIPTFLENNDYYIPFNMTMNSILGHLFANWKININNNQGLLTFDLLNIYYAYTLNINNIIIKSSRILPSTIPDSVTINENKNNSVILLGNMNRKIDIQKSYLFCIKKNVNNFKKSLIFTLGTAILFQEK